MNENHEASVLRPTSMDDQAVALGEEFGFQVWVDFRDMSDGMLHWHARREGWTFEDNLNAYDYEGMRRELEIYTAGEGRDRPKIEPEGRANF